MKFELIPKENILVIIPFLQALDATIPKDILEKRLLDMTTQAYTCLGVYVNDELVGCSGIWIQTRYYSGRSVEPDHVYIDPKFRGKGIAKKMMEWIIEYGKENGCQSSELNCYVHNTKGLEFWDSLEYDRKGIHYLKSISS